MSPGLQRLVYISCDAKAAAKNFVSLARPTSNAFSGDPFLPKRVVPVDLFPHSGCGSRQI
jgi:tRNA (uracil-5-)-methyltransferase